MGHLPRLLPTSIIGWWCILSLATPKTPLCAIVAQGFVHHPPSNQVCLDNTRHADDRTGSQTYHRPDKCENALYWCHQRIRPMVWLVLAQVQWWQKGKGCSGLIWSRVTVVVASQHHAGEEVAGGLSKATTASWGISDSTRASIR